MKRVLVLQQSIEPPGGGNGLGAWVLEALKREFEVSHLSWIPMDLGLTNRFWGTSLDATQIRSLIPPARLRWLSDSPPLTLGLLRTHLIMRYCKAISHDYDAVFCGNSEADFGRRGIQYIIFPWSYYPRPDISPLWYHRSHLMLRAYNRLCRRVSGFSVERMKQNVTLTISDWIAARFHELYSDVATTTVFPPIPGEFPEVPWKDKEDGFVCIGRVSPEKEFHKIIAILDAVRARGHALHLHIIGTSDHGEYYARIRAMAEERVNWVHLGENLTRDELARLVSTQRYGIHGMREEHFGMAVGEMVRAGCIVFVPNGGGQVEIVGDPRLCYDSSDDATERICRVLSDADLRHDLRTHLERRSEQLSVQYFMGRIRDVVGDFVH